MVIVVTMVIGREALGWLDVSALGNQEFTLQQASLVTLAVALVGVALRLPVGFITNNWKPLARLLGLVMPINVARQGPLNLPDIGGSFAGSHASTSPPRELGSRSGSSTRCSCPPPRGLRARRSRPLSTVRFKSLRTCSLPKRLARFLPR